MAIESYGQRQGLNGERGRDAVRLEGSADGLGDAEVTKRLSGARETLIVRADGLQVGRSAGLAVLYVGAQG
jgi:hypothetical protein